MVDEPSERKVHSGIIPRAGGLVIYVSFMASVSAAALYPTKVFMQLYDRQIAVLIAGATLVFLLGLWDDARRLSARFKFWVQMGAALLAFAGGIKIQGISIFSNVTFSLGWLSLPVTLFWFLLVINAMNLIDGLDGLASGLSLFSCVVLVIICATSGRLSIAVVLAAVGGAALGFLKYNFNPASVFLGDSGSYFFGYMLAGFTVLGALKGPVTVAILIPLIALGVPLFDTLFTPIRRFILGQRIFSPDRKHLHHRLLDLGFSQRNAVLLLYGFSILMGVIAIITVHAQDEGIALILLVLSGMIVLAIRKLGYLDFMKSGEVNLWFKDIGESMGISRDRRDFLGIQNEIQHSTSFENLWKNIGIALEKLSFDMAEICLDPRHMEGYADMKNFPPAGSGEECRLLWKRDGFESERMFDQSILKMELPLIAENGKSFGRLLLIKDLRRDAISHYTLRRIEHLRRSALGAIQMLVKGGSGYR